MNTPRRVAGIHPRRLRGPQRKKLDLTQLLTLGAVLITLALAVPSYIAANTQAEQARDEAALARKEAETVAQGQITDRFSKAIEQLGTPDNSEVRLGGIYSLERIARDSERDYPTVMNVLATFVRENTQRLRSPLGHCPDTPPAVGVQAALTVLANPHPEWERGELDLNNACLSEADLTGADLSDADLVDVDLSDAALVGATLDGTYLHRANLTRAHLYGANLTEAQLHVAQLHEASLVEANLTRTMLSGASLLEANVIGAQFHGAQLHCIDLTRAKLVAANLSGTDLSDTSLTNADLRGADLRAADLTDASLGGANLHKANLEEMDQEMLRQARARSVPVR